MSPLLGRAAVAPVLSAPQVRAEQVTQLLPGELADRVGAAGEWHQVRLRRDGCEGWLHRGYAREVDDAEAARWEEESWWTDGAIADAGGEPFELAPGSRVLPAGDEALILGDGRRATIAGGRVGAREEILDETGAIPPEEWAYRAFAGAPYQWGGITPHGVDCSGVVQLTWHLRGVRLPRDARDQAACGVPVAPAEILPGDLLFFGERGDRVTHVAFAAAEETLVHAALACGGMVREPWGPGTRAAGLRPRLVAVRRVTA